LLKCHYFQLKGCFIDSLKNTFPLVAVLGYYLNLIAYMLKVLLENLKRPSHTGRSDFQGIIFCIPVKSGFEMARQSHTIID
jgi:hypothetical protein